MKPDEDILAVLLKLNLAQLPQCPRGIGHGADFLAQPSRLGVQGASRPVFVGTV